MCQLAQSRQCPCPAGREHYPNHRHTHPPLIRRPIPYVSSFLGEEGEKWQVRGIFFAGPSFECSSGHSN